MRRPLFPIVLALTLTVLLSTSAGSRAQRAFLSKYIWRSKLQRPYMQIFREAQAGRLVEAPTRFQRGVDPADEGRERDMRAAMDKKEEGEESRSDYEIEPELEEIKDKAGPSFHIKQISPYLSPYSLFKYR